MKFRGIKIKQTSIILAIIIAVGATAQAQTTGVLRGTVTDPTGAPVVGARITVTLSGTGVKRTAVSDENGTFQFPVLAVGVYSVEIEADGFRKQVQDNVAVNIGQTSVVNANLDIGEFSAVVNIQSDGDLIERSSTQIGVVVGSRAVANLPLNTRDTYQLLQIQPGVQSQLGADLFTGSDRPGVVSVNGGRGRSNNFSVNGGEANDLYVNLPAIQPSPDAIQEFRVLTNGFDAEFGRSSGSVVNVLTKSGTNQFRGNVFEFFRNRTLNARGFFDTVKPDYVQNIFGLTFGGPIFVPKIFPNKNRTYFFFSYEGRRLRQGIPSDVITVPTAAERGGDFSAGAAFRGVLNDAFLAAELNRRPGCAAGGAAAGGAAIVPGARWADIFPNNRIPVQCFDRTAFALLQSYVPQANLGDNQFQAIPLLRRRDNQGTLRVDHTITQNQQLSAFFFYANNFASEPFAHNSASGANVPGFGNLNRDKIFQANVSHTLTLSQTLVNELRLVWFRQAQPLNNSPANASLVENSCPGVAPALCFADPLYPNRGIRPLIGAQHEGLPYIGVSGGFALGNNYQGEIPQTINTYQLVNGFTKIFNKHTAKFGVDARRQHYYMTNYGALNGQFNYFGGGTNDVGFDNLFPNYLLGLPDSYYQTAASPSDFRNTALYLYGQDSWQIKPSLTVNYGLRYELTTPASYDRLGRTQSVRPGMASTRFPCRLGRGNPLIGVFGSDDCSPGGAAQAVFPLGLQVPGDKGVPDGLTDTYFKGFAPRFGVAWTPNFEREAFKKLFGRNGDTSVRAAVGKFYNGLVEGLILAQLVPQPPFGGSTNVKNSLFNTPLVGQDGTLFPNPFNGILTPRPGEPVDYSIFRPILLYGQLPAKLRPQFAYQYHFTVQRNVAWDFVLQVGYVGTLGRDLLATRDINPGSARTCLELNNIPGQSCGPGGADGTYIIPARAIPAGVTLNLPYGSVRSVTGPNPSAITLVGLRPLSSPFCQPTTGAGCPPDGVPVFSSLFSRENIARSRYDALQTLLEKRFSRGLQFQAAYTFSKSLDNASSFEDIVNPFDPSRNRSLSAFHAKHRFVVNFFYELPKINRNGLVGGLLNNWALSGIYTFQTGFPIRLTSSDDRDLTGSFDFELPGRPDLVGRFRTLNPRGKGNYYFDPSVFAPAALGSFGTAPRTICCGPGINNTDLSVFKNIPLSESRRIELRAEIFNILNRAQFFNPSGNITDGVDFGRVRRARDPRQIQFAAKFFF